MNFFISDFSPSVRPSKFTPHCRKEMGPKEKENSFGIGESQTILNGSALE
jgi:hypothetical protein